MKVIEKNNNTKINIGPGTRIGLIYQLSDSSIWMTGGVDFDKGATHHICLSRNKSQSDGVYQGLTISIEKKLEGVLIEPSLLIEK